VSLRLSVHSKLSLGYGAKIFVTSAECQFPTCLPMGIRTVDYAAGGVYVVPTNGKEPYCSKLASITRTILLVRSARKITPHQDSIPRPSCTSSSVYLDRGTSCVSTEVRDNLHVSQLLSSKLWLPNVSIVVSEPKTEEELKNVTIWNKSVKELLGISWITEDEDCIWRRRRRTVKSLLSADIACKAVCWYVEVRSGQADSRATVHCSNCALRLTFILLKHSTWI